MFLTNLKVALRNILKHKGYSAINLFGLVVGLASFMIIMLYVYDELSYDKFHKDSDRIYRVVLDSIEQDGSKTLQNSTPAALTEALTREIPEIENATRLHPPFWGKASLSNENYKYYDNDFLYIDKSFFNVFSFRFIKGDPQSAFENPFSVVLTESLARRFFGDKNAVGQTLVFNQGGDKSLIVTGVIEDAPSQSHLQFDFLTSTLVIRPQWVNNWGTDRHMRTYIKVKPDVRITEVDAKIQNLTGKYEVRSAGVTHQYFAQPLAGLHGIHLSSRLYELAPGGNRLYVQVLITVAFFILVIAGINYVNLATARSAIRAKEIGVRKVVGALRKTVIRQFLVESVLMAVIAGGIAVALTEVSLPFFNDLMQKHLSLISTGSLAVWIGMPAAIFIFGLAAGLYPAFYLSAFRPISILRKQIAFKKKGLDLRKALVVSQFALSAFLMVGIIVVQRQMAYVQSADLGFDKDQVLVIDGFQNTPNRDRGFVVRRTLEALPGVQRVGGTQEMEIGLSRGGVGGIKLRGGDGKPVTTAAYVIDDGFVDVFGLEFIEGRNFSSEFSGDMNGDNIIVNEMAVKQLGIRGSALGKQIVRHFGREQTIIGVVKDFHTSSLREEIFPIVMIYDPQAWYAVAKLSGGEIRETLIKIEETWDKFVPGKPIDFYFMDDAINQLYRSETNFEAVFSVMTGVTIMIACLGLFGLVAYTAEQRTKEIGVRKVLGATVANVIALLSSEFVRLVVFANIVAWPVAYVVMNKWLENFAYRIDLGLRDFALAAFSVLLIAVLTVSSQAIRAALANPVASLRHE